MLCPKWVYKEVPWKYIKIIFNVIDGGENKRDLIKCNLPSFLCDM
jgi:hypothetical protein